MTKINRDNLQSRQASCWFCPAPAGPSDPEQRVCRPSSRGDLWRSDSLSVCGHAHRAPDAWLACYVSFGMTGWCAGDDHLTVRCSGRVTSRAAANAGRCFSTGSLVPPGNLFYRGTGSTGSLDLLRLLYCFTLNSAGSAVLRHASVLLDHSLFPYCLVSHSIVYFYF